MLKYQLSHAFPSSPRQQIRRGHPSHRLFRVTFEFVDLRRGVTSLGPARLLEHPMHRRCRIAARIERCGDRIPRRPRRCGRYWRARPTAPGLTLVHAEVVGRPPRRFGGAPPIVRRGGGRSDWAGWAPSPPHCESYGFSNRRHAHSPETGPRIRLRACVPRSITQSTCHEP